MRRAKQRSKQFEFKEVYDLFLGTKALTLPEIEKIRKKNRIMLMAYTPDFLHRQNLNPNDFIKFTIKTPPPVSRLMQLRSAYPESHLYIRKNSLSKVMGSRINRAFEIVNEAIDAKVIEFGGDYSETEQPPYKIGIKTELFEAVSKDKRLSAAIRTVNRLLATTVATTVAEMQKPIKPH